MLQARIFSIGIIFSAVLAAAAPADDLVDGPPKLLIDARVESTDGRGGLYFTATSLSWDETNQAWPATAESDVPTRAANMHGRKILALQSGRTFASVRTLRFSTLDDQPLNAEQVAVILKAGRAVAFVEKGCKIHPTIAAALHPETLVVTRTSYANDPVIVPLPEKR